jgi:hypothetical protein
MSAHAKSFFNDYLGATIKELDAKYNAGRQGIAALTEGPYQPESDPLCLARWSRAWTAAVVVETLDWLRQKGCGQLSDEEISSNALALALWTTLRQDGRVICVKPGPRAALPSGGRAGKGLIFALALRIVMAQTLHYDEARWSDSGRDSVVRVRMRALDCEDVGDNHYYWGRNISQIRFAILAECLLASASAAEGGAPPCAVAGGPAMSQEHGHDPLTPVERRCVQRIDAARAAGKMGSTRDGGASRFLESDFPDELELTAAGGESASGLWWSGTVDFQRAGGETLAAHGDPILGSLELPIHSLQHVAWIDVTFLGRSGGLERVLPLQLVDDAAESADSAQLDEAYPRQLVVLDVARERSLTPETLRNVLADPDRTFWAYEESGLGIFVVALLDLDAV